MDSHIALGLLGLSLLVSACSSGVGAAPQTNAVVVNMTDTNRFEPATLTVQRGATVTWTNVGSVGHTVTDDPSLAVRPANAVLPSSAQPFDSGDIGGGQSWSHTFDTPGNYTYFCIPHESLGMVGRVVVQ